MIDALCFTGHYPFRKLSPEKLDEIIVKYKSLGFKAIAIMKFEALFFRDTDIANKILLRDLKQVKNKDVKIYPIASLNPLYFVDIKNLIKDYHSNGFKAIDISPPYHGFSLKSRRLINFAIQVLKYNMPLIILNLIEDIREMHRAYKFRYRIKIDELCAFLNEVNTKIKNAKILLASFSSRELKQVRSLYKGDLFVDISHQYILGQPIDDIKILVELYGEDNVLFSSCFPLKYIHPAIYKVMYSDVNDRIKMKILEINAKRFYGEL